MNIVYLLDVFPNAQSETFVLSEMLQLEDFGHTVHVVSSRGEQIKNRRFDASSLKKRVSHTYGSGAISGKIVVSFLSILFFSVTSPVLAVRLFRSALKEASCCNNFIFIVMNFIRIYPLKPDVVQLAFPRNNYLEAAMVLKKMHDVPVSCTLRAMDIYAQKKNSWYFWKLINRTDCVITISEYNKRFLTPRVTLPIHVIHSAIDTDLFVPEHNSSSFSNGISIITTARFVEKKGIEYMLRAFDMLQRNNYYFHAVIVGEGPCKEQYEKDIERFSLSSRVDIRSTVSHEDIPTLLSASDIFILPCIIGKNGDRDILPNAVKEAMACGIIVITSRIAGIEEMVEHGKNGFLVPEKSSGHIAEQIAEVQRMDDSVLAEIRNNARRKIIAEFDIINEARKLEACLKNIKN
ncbi:MAG: glycosyltransferase family 4 protein [Fibrobacterota bacterium]